MRPLRSRATFVLVLVVVVGFYVLCAANRYTPDGYEMAAFAVGLASIIYGNDKGAAAREAAKTPEIHAEGSTIDAPGSTIHND